jgi:transposase-like protein
MTRRARRNHTPAFKAKVALAALKGEKTLAELAEQAVIRRSQLGHAVVPGAEVSRIDILNGGRGGFHL